MGSPSITQLKDRPIVCPYKSELKTKTKTKDKKSHTHSLLRNQFIFV